MSDVLAPEAVAFVADLERRFGARRRELLGQRAARQREIARRGWEDAAFLDETKAIRDDPSWRVAATPPALRDRRVEITGPTERKMTINALNSGAKVWLADLEDANTPHWANVVGGQENLRDAVRDDITYRSPDGREYRVRDNGALPVIMMRPRGWHLDERHLPVDGAPATAALVDVGLFLFHNGRELHEQGRGPYFYLPKMESHLEARLWAEVFAYSEEVLGIPGGTVRATVLIETLPAAFEMEEILYELRDYAAGLNAGRWDYLFSLIKVFRSAGAGYILPDRNAVTMTAPFMRAYTELLVSTCHRRGAFAIGGMAAFIPNRGDEVVTATAMEKVRADKRREAHDGFDGSWVAHPDLVALCHEEFSAVLGERPNQVDRLRADVEVAPGDLLRLVPGDDDFTEAGLRNDVEVAVRYLESWLEGNGAVAINNLMEDAATAEIARSQVWQWLHNDVVLDTGVRVTREVVQQILDESALTAKVRQLFVDVALGDDYVEFLTLAASALID